MNNEFYFRVSFVTIIVLVLSMIWMIDHKGYGIRINRSESLPFKMFFAAKLNSPPERNQFVCFRHPDMSMNVAKQVVGVAGDIIAVEDDQVYVNGVSYGKIKKNSPSGIVLNPISISQIPDDYVFLHATHEDSFDSRYEEFGLIKLENIKETLWPIF